MNNHEEIRARSLTQAWPEILGLEYGDFSRLLDDFAEAECSAEEYCRRIGRPNLRSYLDTLAAGDRRKNG